MDESDYEIKLLERVVELAWNDEQLIMKVLMKQDLDRSEKYCQGITRNVERRLVGIFKTAPFYFEFKGGSPHVALLVHGFADTYIVDGSIRQFLPDEKRTAFRAKEYPLGKDYDFPKLQTWG